MYLDLKSMEILEHFTFSTLYSFSCMRCSRKICLKFDIVQVGSADHHIHYYDLRNAHLPLYVFNGHRKTVSYVKFVSQNELASASTDSTLRLWDVQENRAVRCYMLSFTFSHMMSACLTAYGFALTGLSIHIMQVLV